MGHWRKQWGRRNLAIMYTNPTLKLYYIAKPPFVSEVHVLGAVRSCAVIGTNTLEKFNASIFREEN
jgi:hypothetical protein